VRLTHPFNPRLFAMIAGLHYIENANFKRGEDE